MPAYRVPRRARSYIARSRLAPRRVLALLRASAAGIADLVRIRLACRLLLYCESQHRSGAAPGLMRHAGARDQHLRGGDHQLEALGAPRQLPEPALSCNRFAAIVDEGPLTPLRRI